jgi:hypothetical protein
MGDSSVEKDHGGVLWTNARGDAVAPVYASDSSDVPTVVVLLLGSWRC